MELPSKRLSCSQSIIQFEGDSLHYEPDEDPLLTQPCRRLSSLIEDARTLNLIQMIKEHEAYLETCKETNRINEAEKVYAKIVILKKELAISKKKELEVRHQEERERLDQMQMAEMEELVLFWDIRIQNYKSEAQTHIENNLEKYKNDHQELKEGLEVSLSQKIVVNPQRMIYKKIINTLVKKRDFEEAKHFKNLCVGMEREDLERTIESRDTKMKTASNQLMQKQLTELSYTKARVTTGLTNLNRMKKEECEKLRLKFQHMQKQVAKAQAQELAKLETLLKSFVPVEKRRFPTNVKNHNEGHRVRSPINLRVDERVQTYSYCSPPQVNNKRKMDSASKAKVLAYRRSLEGLPSKSPQRSVALPSATMNNIQVMENKGWRYKKEHLQTQCK